MADDIKVRLSPQGVEQVKEAFKTVERESKRSSSEAAKGTDRIGKSLGNLKRQVIQVAAAYLSFRGVASLFGGIIRNTTQQEQALAQLEARIKSTGGAAGLTADQLVDMSKRLQRATTFDDQAIQQTQALLLTFTKIAGKEFAGATEAVLDMSIAMGTDLRSSAVQVGKALNDPILGVTALQRSGIQFTGAQKQLIRTLVETGRTAEAQRVILAELETQFGGSARAARNTLGGALAALKNAAGDLLEADGGLPGITSSVNELTTTLNDPAVREGIQVIIRGVLNLTEVAAKAASALGKFAAGLKLALTGSSDPLIQMDDRIRALDERIARLQNGLGGRTTQGAKVLENLLIYRKQLVEELSAAYDEAGRKQQAAVAPPTADGAGSPIDIRVNLRRLQSDLAAAGTLLADEIRRTRERLDRELALGLITYEEFFARRAELELKQIDQTLAQRRNALALLTEENRLLDERGELTEEHEGRRKQLVAEITVLERQRGDVGIKATNDLIDAEKKLSAERFSLEQRFLELQGRNREARLAELEKEIEGARRLLQAQGLGLEEIEQRLGQLRELVVVRLDFDQAIADGETALAELDRIRQRIRGDVEAGLLTQFQAEQQILGIEAQRVELLQGIAANALAAAQALGDPAAIATAEQFNEQVRQLSIGIDRLTKDMVAFEQGAQDAFRGSLQGVLEGLGTQITSLSGAIKSFANSFVQQLHRMAAEILARRATFALLGALGGSFFGIGQSAGGGAVGAATGGYIRGPGTGTSDSIPAWLSNREYVVRASVVKTPGMLEFLEQLNSGRIANLPRMSPRVPKFNQGGLVTAGDFGRRQRGAGGGTVQVTVVTPDPDRFRESEGRVAAATANAQAIAANRNS